MKKFWNLFLLCVVLGVMTGCFSKENKGVNYERCNATSRVLNIAETELGFYYQKDSMLYYADKSDLSKWVPACNKPDCTHGRTTDCNAYLPSNIIHKDGKFYCIGNIGDRLDDNFWIAEVAQDGSGLKKIFKVPFEGMDWVNGYDTSMMFGPDQLVIEIEYLREDGFYQEEVVRLDGDSLHILYEEKNETKVDSLIMPARTWYGIRGKSAIRYPLLEENPGYELDVIWGTSGDTLEQIILPEDIEDMNLVDSYLTDKTFTYYDETEGFYEFNLETREKTLLHACYAETGIGAILTEEYMVEHNLKGNGVPENPYLRIYDGKEWREVEIPETIKKSDKRLYVQTIASDRILFTHSAVSEKAGFGLCYVMLDEKNPELLFFNPDALEEIEEVEQSTSETDSEQSNPFAFKKIDEITIFDNEYGLLKVTGCGVKPKEENHYYIELYWEKKSSDLEYTNWITTSVNGIFCNPAFMISSEEKDGYYQVMLSDLALEKSGVAEHYTFEQYTDIEVMCYITDESGNKLVDENAHIYPQGEELAQTYIRESESTDFMVADNEAIKVCVVGYEKNNISYDTVRFFIENKTEEVIYFKIAESAVNQFTIHGDANVNKGISVPPKTSAFYSASACDKSFLDEYLLKDVGMIQMLVKAYPTEYITYIIPTGEDLIKECVTLYPQGEENAQTFVRTPKATDVVLLDNAYITVVTNPNERATGMVFADAPIPLYVTNKTDQMLTLKIEAASSNGLMSNINNPNDEMHIFPHNNGIVWVQYFSHQTGDVKELLLRAYPYGGGEVGKDLVTEKVAIIAGEDTKDYEREPESTDKVLVENDMLTMTFTGKQTFMQSTSINFYVENHTNKDIAFYVDKLVINGKEIMLEGIDSLYDEIIFANGSKKVFIDRSQDIRTVEMSFHAYYFDYVTGECGEELIEETITLKL